jgi:enediyne biosynthesis thioesterase
MSLTSLTQNRISLHFEYFRLADETEELVARGKQDVICMRREGPQMVTTPVPEELRDALRRVGAL